MHRTIGLQLISVIILTASAQSIDLSGTVSNQGGDPIAGAVVTLVGQDLADTTDAGGTYSITGSTGAVVLTPIRFSQTAEESSLRGGTIRLNLSKAAPVRIEIFDMRGQLLRRVLSDHASAGGYRFDISKDLLGARVMAIRVSIGETVSVLRYVTVAEGARSAFASKAVSSAAQGAAKMRADIDLLRVSASGYVDKEVSVSSYEGVVDIVLDTVDLPHFSFFVTSLKALQELSGSQDGFGGDFRFGKTGPGAGLRGADSICECIAERSMPGSKVKIWRAFLSVTADENGEQVDAIDRIGQGPWYDRLGRLVAPTIADLLNTRPQNGDPTIRDDLPNEDGVPNHRPDPNLPAVDNHHMITGSGTNGRLYSANATCQDWTSASAGSRARWGLSWPRGMGGFGGTSGSHWISGGDSPGCEAGIQLDGMGGAPRGSTIIGGGGGYGGFYCFALNP